MSATAREVIELPKNEPGGELTPLSVLDRAVTAGATPETLEKLMTLQERWERNQARRAFDNAMAAAKAEIPVIVKNRQVGFTSKKPGAASTSYKHEDLAEIARTIDPILGKHGLSYRFRTTSAPNEPVTVTCIISHRDGHSEENTLAAGRDDSGNKNAIQMIGSTVTYLQRYTLKAALGLAASADDDGKNSGPASPLITEEQAEHLRALIVEVGADLPAFLEHFGIETLPELPANAHARAIALLERKAQKAGKAAT